MKGYLKRGKITVLTSMDRALNMCHTALVSNEKLS